MAGFIQNMLWNSVSGFVEAGTRTVGGFAGDALIKAGDLVEGGGRSVGNGIEKKATGIGSTISGQTAQKPSAKALPSTARRPAAHRSNSLPASSKPLTGGSGVPLGAKKYSPPSAGAAKKSIGGVTKTAGGVVGGARGTVGGVTGGVGKPLGSAVGRANSIAGGATRGLGGVVNTANSAAKRNPLPKAYPNSSTAQSKGVSIPKPYPNNSSAQSKAASLPKPYGSNSFGGGNSYPSEKKVAVRPGQSRPFALPKEKDEGKKAYPGTKTLPGQGTRTPVKRTYTPAKRYEPPAKAGQATFF